jgi:hypothetical protein
MRLVILRVGRLQTLTWNKKINSRAKRVFQKSIDCNNEARVGLVAILEFRSSSLSFHFHICYRITTLPQLQPKEKTPDAENYAFCKGLKRVMPRQELSIEVRTWLNILNERDTKD